MALGEPERREGMDLVEDLVGVCTSDPVGGHPVIQPLLQRSAQGPANMNVCVFQIQCTYMNYANGKPTDVVRHKGTVKQWTLNTASTGGTVRLHVDASLGAGQAADTGPAANCGSPNNPTPSP